MMLLLVVGSGGVVTLVMVLAVCCAGGLRYYTSRSHSVLALGRVGVALACVCVKRLLSIMHGHAGIW